MEISYQPTFERSADLVKNLTAASSLKSWIDQQALDVSWIASSQRDALIRLAHYSTRIEGNPLTLPEVAALAEGKDLPAAEQAKREVLNYFAALRWIWRSSPEQNISEKDLLNLHGFYIEEDLTPITSSPWMSFLKGIELDITEKFRRHGIRATI